jgi:hypothetical protein
MVTGCALDGLACPSVVAVAVGEAVAAAPAGMDTAIATGGRLLPGAALAEVVQVTCWPSVAHVQPGPAADSTLSPVGTLNTSVVVPVTGPEPGSTLTVAWYVPVPGEVNAPTGASWIVTSGAGAASVTGMLTGVELDGAVWPAVVAVAVGDVVPVAPAGMLVTIVTGGRLAPGCAVAGVVQVAC